MSVGLGRSQLDSKGGVVGGTIDVNVLRWLVCWNFTAGIYWEKHLKTDLMSFYYAFLWKIIIVSILAYIFLNIQTSNPVTKFRLLWVHWSSWWDYMGSSILMGIFFSNADLKLQDEWKVNLYNTLDSSMTDKRYLVKYYFWVLYMTALNIFSSFSAKTQTIFPAITWFSVTINMNEKLVGKRLFGCF